MSFPTMNQLFCKHYFSNTDSKFSKCDNGCGLELGEVLKSNEEFMKTEEGQEWGKSDRGVV